MAKADFNRMAQVYDSGRALSGDALEAWRAALLRHLPTGPTLPVLDLGSGTGHFAAALADWLDATVIGIDPAKEMLRVAAPAGPRGRVQQVIADYEPLSNKGGDGAIFIDRVR